MQAIEAILGRRTVPQIKMAEPGPSEAELRVMLEAGCAAPDHGRVRPWRFLVVRGEARQRLGELFAEAALAANPAASAADVCNEAENSHRGGYTVNGGPIDPNPPAFLRGSQMRVGNGNGEGLENAAEHSPALRLCGPEDGDGGGGGGPIDVS